MIAKDKTVLTSWKIAIVKKYLLLLIPIAMLFGACKKKSNPVYTYMTLFVDGDSVWTTTDVTALVQTDKSLIITANNRTAVEDVSFTLLDYRSGKKTYYVGTGSVPGYNYGSSAAYDYSGYRATSTSGQVAITNQTTRTIEGTFDVATTKVHITGTFSAPLPQ